MNRMLRRKMKQKMKILPKQTALLVIDMQNDFVEEGALIEVKGIRKNLSYFKKFIDICREKNILIVYTRHCYSPEKNPIEAKLFPGSKKWLKPRTHGWQIYEFLRPEQSDILIDKTRYDAFFQTPLQEILQEYNTKNIIITGTMTEICCESTARTAMYHDYNILFCYDLTYTSDPKRQDVTLGIIKSHFGTIVSSKEISLILL